MGERRRLSQSFSKTPKDKPRFSRTVYVPSAVSSFFEICDRDRNGEPIKDLRFVGARGGGFIIARGTSTVASLSNSDEDGVFINGEKAEGRTTFKTLGLLREIYRFRNRVRIDHTVEPPIGCGFGTSGSGSLGASSAIADLFGIHLTLNEVAHFPHVAEILCTTGLGTVLSLGSGLGGFGLVTEPGELGVGRVEGILDDYAKYSLVCIILGPLEKSSVIKSEFHRLKVNEWGRRTMESVKRDPTLHSLLSNSRKFAENIGLDNSHLLKLCSRLISLGAVGASQNMIGNAVHALVYKEERSRFLRKARTLASPGKLLVTDLATSGPSIKKVR